MRGLQVPLVQDGQAVLEVEQLALFLGDDLLQPRLALLLVDLVERQRVLEDLGEGQDGQLADEEVGVLHEEHDAVDLLVVVLGRAHDVGAGLLDELDLLREGEVGEALVVFQLLGRFWHL